MQAEHFHLIVIAKIKFIIKNITMQDNKFSNQLKIRKKPSLLSVKECIKQFQDNNNKTNEGTNKQ